MQERCNPKVAGSSPGEEAQNQNDWSVTNQIDYTGLRQYSYLKFIFRLFLL